MISFDGVTVADEHLSTIQISEGAVTIKGKVERDGYGRLLESMLTHHHVGDVVVFECIDFSGREFSGVGTITQLDATTSPTANEAEFIFVVTITAGVQQT